MRRRFPGPEVTSLLIAGHGIAVEVVAPPPVDGICPSSSLCLPGASRIIFPSSTIPLFASGTDASAGLITGLGVAPSLSLTLRLVRTLLLPAEVMVVDVGVVGDARLDGLVYVLLLTGRRGVEMVRAATGEESQLAHPSGSGSLSIMIADS